MSALVHPFVFSLSFELRHIRRWFLYVWVMTIACWRFDSEVSMALIKGRNFSSINCMWAFSQNQRQFITLSIYLQLQHYWHDTAHRMGPSAAADACLQSVFWVWARNEDCVTGAVCVCVYLWEYFQNCLIVWMASCLHIMAIQKRHILKVIQQGQHRSDTVVNSQTDPPGGGTNRGRSLISMKLTVAGVWSANEDLKAGAGEREGE